PPGRPCPSLPLRCECAHFSHFSHLSFLPTAARPLKEVHSSPCSPCPVSVRTPSPNPSSTGQDCLCSLRKNTLSRTARKKKTRLGPPYHSSTRPTPAACALA